MNTEITEIKECLDGVYARIGGSLVAHDTHVGLRVLALRRARELSLSYREAGEEIYPACIGHMLSHGRVDKMVLWQQIGRSGKATFALPGSVVVAGIAADIAIMDDAADKRYPRFVRPNQRAEWQSLAAAVAVEMLSVTISLDSTGVDVTIQLDAAHTAAYPWLWDGRLPADTCRAWLDALITAWLDGQPAVTESDSAHESLRSADAAIQAERKAKANYQARAKALREAGTIVGTEIGLVLHGYGIGDPQCEYAILTPEPGDHVLSVDYADVSYDECYQRVAALAMARRIGADLDRNVVIIIRGKQGNGCRYDGVIYLAASKDDYWQTPGISVGCKRFGIRRDYGEMAR